MQDEKVQSQRFAMCTTTVRAVSYSIKKQKRSRSKPTSFFYSGPAGFEPSNAAVKVLCLTAWRQPNIFSGNALFRPVKSQICRFKRYPMLSRTLPNRHGVSRTPIFGFGDRHATINTTRLHIFNYFFQFFNQLAYL